MTERSRREFLAATAAGTVGAAFSRSLEAKSRPTPDLDPTVVLARRDGVVNDAGVPDQKLVREMVSHAVLKVTGAGTERDAWRSLFTPKDVVGIKVNSLVGPKGSTHKEVVAAIADGLVSAGLKPERIIVWDKSSYELKRCGYKIKTGRSGLRCFVPDAPLVGYEPRPRTAGSVGSCLSRILSELCTATINVPILKDHEMAGITVAMKNWYGAIHNPNKYHDNNCDPFIADLSSHPLIRDKQRLIICDGLVALYNGGPGYKSQFAWDLSTILASRDPVALDRVSADIIEEKRKEHGLPTLKDVGREPKCIATAAALGLGEDDRTKIKKVEA